MSADLLIETVLITVFRFSLFYGCGRYVLRSLYHDLQDLSADSNDVALQPGDRTLSPEIGIELPALPSPTTHSTKSSGRPRTSVHYAMAQTTFSACFSESCTMFLMLMLQGLNVGSSSARLFNWKLSLFALLALILICVPLFVSLVMALGFNVDFRRSSLVPRIVICLAFVALYLFSLSYIPLPLAVSSADILTVALSRLVVLGTIILGLLSGFGAISNAWAFFPVFSRNRKTPPTEQDVVSAEQALVRVRNDLQSGRDEAKRRDAAKSQAERTWVSRVVPTFRGDDNLQELRGLEALAHQMARNVASLRERRANAIFAGTFKGRLFNIAGRLFAVYCVIRVISCALNILTPPSSTTTYPDLIGRFVAYFLSLVSSSDVTAADAAIIARQVSLVLVGVIILTSIRLVLRGATRALRVTSRALGASLMLLLLAQIMGIYLLSTIVQLRTSFPPDADAMSLFATVPAYEMFGSLFDWAFLGAACASAVVRWGAERVNGVGGD